MTLTQLEYVLALNKHKNFKKAAEACHITQPTLSMQVQKLEEDLGLIIFDRSKSPIVATLKGKIFIDQAKIVLGESKKLKDIALKTIDPLKGELRVGIIPTLAPYLIPLFLDNFLKKYPHINLIINEFQTHEIINLLENDQLDLGLLVTPLEKTNFFERVLFYEPFLAYFSPQNELLKKKKINKDDLKNEKVWVLAEGHCFRNQTLDICTRNLNKNYQNIIFEGGQLETLKNLVKRNNGLTLVPYLSTHYSKELDLIRPFSGQVPTREVSIVVNRFFHKEEMVDVLEEEILAVLPEGIESKKSKKIKVIKI